MRGELFNEQGELHHYVNVYVNNEVIEGLDTPLKEGDEVAVIPAMAAAR